jgi:hypothetical protein
MMDLFIIFFVLFPFSPFYGFIFGLPITQKINLPCLFFFFIYYLFSLPFFVLNLGRKLGTIPNHAMRGKNKKIKKERGVGRLIGFTHLLNSAHTHSIPPRRVVLDWLLKNSYVYPRSLVILRLNPELTSIHVYTEYAHQFATSGRPSATTPPCRSGGCRS